MSPRKLSDGDRQEILSLYRNTNETTSTLAMRFGVSSSTVSRFLKNSLTETEYEDLIQEKRLARTTKNDDDEQDLLLSMSSENTTLENSILEKQFFPLKQSQEEQLNLNFEDDTSDSGENVQEDFIDHPPETDNLLDEDNQEVVEPMEQEFNEILTEEKETVIDIEDIEEEKEEVLDSVEMEEEEEVLDSVEMEEEEEVLDSVEMEEGEKEVLELIEEEEEEEVLESVKVLAAMYGEDMEEEDDIDDEEDDIDDEEEYEDEDIERKLIASSTSTQNQLQVLPFDRATFPRVCYIVIDRYAELVTKPLKDFGHLGNIPSSEFLQLTLPIFDNHKVAKRYCDAKGTLRSRKGKVIKVPDGKLLQKTSQHLKAKGISRILMDGKIYQI